MEKEDRTVKTKRNIRVKNTKNVGDRSKLTMFDLLSYNPPLSKEQREKNESRESEEAPVESIISSEEVNETEETNDDTAGVEQSHAGPRVKVGPNGEIVLDEESCIIKRKKTKSSAPPIVENSKQVAATYASFRNREGLSKQRWTEKETVRFYTALALIGTDFTLMSTLFFKGKRTRLDLRNKFKKEERTHKALVDQALKRCDLTNLPTADQLDEMISTDDEDDENASKSGGKNSGADDGDDSEYSTRTKVVDVSVDRITRSKANKQVNMVCDN